MLYIQTAFKDKEYFFEVTTESAVDPFLAMPFEINLAEAIQGKIQKQIIPYATTTYFLYVNGVKAFVSNTTNVKDALANIKALSAVTNYHGLKREEYYSVYRYLYPEEVL